MSGFFHHHLFSNKNPDFESGIGHMSSENLIVPSTWKEHNNNSSSSKGSCVFPCQGNERPSHGLSLSLSSSNPSSIGLQSFELIRHAANNSNPDNPEEVRFMDSQGDIRMCNYLGPAQELLNEFCSLQSTQNDVPKRTQKQKQQSLHSLEFLDLQKRKRRLLSMLEEVERRYMHYCDRMKVVVSSFDSQAGEGAAAVYSSLASKAMSKHFRSLKDAIVTEIDAARKAIGEKDPVAPGTSRGETPRLRVIDQALRHQRALKQMSMMESHPWRPQRGLPERSVSVLRAWLFEHFLYPYPSDVDKHILARQTGLSRSQVSNWFINARVRLWKPMVEEMYMEESNDGGDDDSNDRPSTQNLPSADLKPTPDQLQLARIDSECLSSIISNSDKNDSGSNRGHPNKGYHGHHDHHPAGFGAFGAVELDFSSYNHHADGHNFTGEGGRVGGGGVSLTLGLQHHGGNDVSSLYFTGDHIVDCQTGQYSILDGDDHNSPYGNLMGAQLMHDLAG